MKEYKPYINLWRSVVVIIIMDYLDKKRRYSIVRYLRNNREDFELICNLAFLDPNYMLNLMEKINNNRTSFNSNHRYKDLLTTILRGLE